MKTKESSAPKSLSISKKKKPFFIKPFRKCLVDLEIYIIVNIISIYLLLFLSTDTTVAMVAAIWVGIVAWRGGTYAGLIGAIIINLSTSIAINMPPHGNIPMLYYFNGKIPGALIGFLQCIITGGVVGYISSLIHQLRGEIHLREQTQKDLEQKIAELDAFGHTVAHDLKNPLMVINMSIDSLSHEFESSDNLKVKKKLEFIDEGTKHMVNIIESILMLAGVKKIDAKEFKHFSISESVNDALKRMECIIESNGVKVTKPEKWPTVFGYAPWITEVWVNYINNAIKYGGNPTLQIKPIIELGFDKPQTFTTTNSEHIRFWVKDNGEGIEKDKTGTLFREFTRLHTREKKEGHGLGLSIVKTIIDKFDGIVGVESELGKGSLFYFTLPVKKAVNN